MLVTILGRIAERLLITCGAILSLWLGYRLFFAYVNDVSKAQISGRGFVFKAERIGPGVFFALFGAVVMVYSISTRVTASNVSTDPSGVVNGTATYSGAMSAGSGASAASDRLRAFVTLEQVARTNPDEDAKAKLNLAAVGLQGIEATLVDDALKQKGRFAEWQQLSNLRPLKEPELAAKLQADPALRRRFYEVEELLAQGY